MGRASISCPQSSAADVVVPIQSVIVRKPVYSCWPAWLCFQSFIYFCRHQFLAALAQISRGKPVMYER